MSYEKTGTYVKTEDGKIYVRGSCYQEWPGNAFSADDALELAAQLTSAANRLNGGNGAVTIKLARNEAEALAAVLNSVGGDPDKSPRGLVKKVSDRMKAEGVKTPGHKLDCVAGGLWFRDYDGQPISAEIREAAEAVYGLALMLGLA